MLQRPEGATVDEGARATGWQRHTARCVFSGTLKKKLGRYPVRNFQRHGSSSSPSGTDGLQTPRWRGVDSNHQFRVSRHRCPHVDFSVEAGELVDLVGDWALTFAAAACDLVHCRSRSGRHDETRAELRPGLYRAMADHRDVRVGRDRPGRIGARYLQ